MPRKQRCTQLTRIAVHGVRRLGEPVVGELPLARGLHHPGPAEIRQMPRDRRLRQGKDLDDVAHAQLAGGEDAQDADACRIGEALEEHVQIGNDGSDGGHGQGPSMAPLHFPRSPRTSPRPCGVEVFFVSRRRGAERRRSTAARAISHWQSHAQRPDLRRRGQDKDNVKMGMMRRAPMIIIISWLGDLRDVLLTTPAPVSGFRPGTAQRVAIIGEHLRLLPRRAPSG